MLPSIILIVITLLSACAPLPILPPQEILEWKPARIATPPITNLDTWPPQTTISLDEADYKKFWDNPNRYKTLTIKPTPLTQYNGEKELMDYLENAYNLTPEKEAILIHWLKEGGILWVKFGVFLQGHEWVRNREKRLPPLPNLRDFTIFGLPTHPLTFAATRYGAFAIEPKTFFFHNKAQHPTTANIHTLQLTQSTLQTTYPIVNADQGAALIQDGEQVYATIVKVGQGAIVSTLPFDPWVETDGKKYRLNFPERLSNHLNSTSEPDTRENTTSNQ